MIQHFVKRSQSDQLTLIFAGWGMDYNITNNINNLVGDLCVCYNYASLDFDPAPLAQYTSITLVAWSMGVWAASRTITQHPELPITSSLAINGTQSPIDAERGIVPAIFAATLANISDCGMERFYRRMCDSKRDLFNHFDGCRPAARTMEDIAAELQALQEAVLSSEGVNYSWQSVVIGESDRIFTPENQKRAWEGVTSRISADAHYIKLEEYI